MHVAIIGAGGMIGRKLAAELARHPIVAAVPIDRLTLLDIHPTEPAPYPFDVAHLVGDASATAVGSALVASRPDIVFHVAATAMGQADADFAAGYRINFDTVRVMLEAIRLENDGYCPRFVHASSIGVYGPPFPDVIDDDLLPRPDSSYGTQKLMSEALISDYTRCGFVDGISIRLPTIAVRPGVATHGNSGFFSNIIREPLAGRRAHLPVSPDVRHWLASPKTAIAQLIHAAAVPRNDLDGQYILTMPGLSVSVEEQLEALRGIAGEDVIGLIDRDPLTATGPAAYPARFSARRAKALGFTTVESSFAEVIDFYLADEIRDRTV